MIFYNLHKNLNISNNMREYIRNCQNNSIKRITEHILLKDKLDKLNEHIVDDEIKNSINICDICDISCDICDMSCNIFESNKSHKINNENIFEKNCEKNITGLEYLFQVEDYSRNTIIIHNNELCNIENNDILS